VFGPGQRPFSDGPRLPMELIGITMYRSGVATPAYRPVSGSSGLRTNQLARCAGWI